MWSPITVTLLNHIWRGSVTSITLIHLRYLRYQAIIQDFPREVFRLLSHLVMIISRKLLLHQGASGSSVLFVDLYSQSLSLDLDQNLLSPRSKDMIPIKARPSAVRRVESRSASLKPSVITKQRWKQKQTVGKLLAAVKNIHMNKQNVVTQLIWKSQL